MVQTPTKPITLEEFLHLPETEPGSEYIDGEIIQKPMPQGEHSVLQTELASAINLAIKPHKLGRAFSELRCNYPTGSRSSVYGGVSIIPDLSVFQSSRIPRNENGGVANIFNISPDWSIEILSPNQSQTKVTKNILHCLNHGTQMGWLIDPQEQCVLIYLPDQPTRIYDQLNSKLPIPEFAQDFDITLESLFAWLLD